jgi:DNA-binding CsgD family transcriptional regulator
MRPFETMLTQTIEAIGEPDFVAVAARAMRRAYGFDLAAVFLHRAGLRPQILFEELGPAGGRLGVENYVRATWRINPLLRLAQSEGVLRARDFGPARPRPGGAERAFLVDAPEEELGFRTVGWPPRLEEVALHFPAWGGKIELGLYRDRARGAGPDAECVREMLAPIRSAFVRHHALTGGARSRPLEALSEREREVCDLLLAGCSSEAVALRLCVSRHTIKDHRKNIYRKLRISSLGELFSVAGREAGTRH